MVESLFLVWFGLVNGHWSLLSIYSVHCFDREILQMKEISSMFDCSCFIGLKSILFQVEMQLFIEFTRDLNRECRDSN